MSPIPCAHCGINFMRTELHPDAPLLCNSCVVKENLRNPKQEEAMSFIEIKIKIPLEEHKEIEEICINEGISFSQYFLSLYHTIKDLEDHPTIEPSCQEISLPVVKKSNSNKKVEK